MHPPALFFRVKKLIFVTISPSFTVVLKAAAAVTDARAFPHALPVACQPLDDVGAQGCLAVQCIRFDAHSAARGREVRGRDGCAQDTLIEESIAAEHPRRFITPDALGPQVVRLCVCVFAQL